MTRKLEATQLRDGEITAKLDIDVHDMDLAAHKDAHNPQCIDTAVTAVRTVMYNYDERSWLQRATLIFLFFAPENWEEKCKLHVQLIGGQ